MAFVQIAVFPTASHATSPAQPVSQVSSFPKDRASHAPQAAKAAQSLPKTAHRAHLTWSSKTINARSSARLTVKTANPLVLNAKQDICCQMGTV